VAVPRDVTLGEVGTPGLRKIQSRAAARGLAGQGNVTTEIPK
jgi:hypothetical protein